MFFFMQLLQPCRQILQLDHVRTPCNRNSRQLEQEGTMTCVTCAWNPWLLGFSVACILWGTTALRDTIVEMFETAGRGSGNSLELT
jgi:hypothetical protein